MAKKILVVDDEVQIVKLISQRLEASGYETFGAHDSYQCIKFTKMVEPDLILLDIKMPAGGGIHAFNSLRSSIYTENIPIIFITAYPGPEIEKQVKELGAEGYFAKPFNSAELVEKIKSLIGD
jgi:CheY-like chemotaxis protein